MDSRRRLALLIVGLGGLMVLGGLTLANYRFACGSPGGSDFLPGWVAGRLLLTKGWSPYGEQVSAEIQHMFYGGEASAGGEILFVYPLHLMVVMAPFAAVRDYELARALWMTFLEVALVSIALLSVSLVRWRMSRGLLIAVLVFASLWYHGVRALVNGNVVAVCALFVVLCFLMIRSGHDLWAGLFLGLAAMKPNVMLLVSVFIVLWALSRRRWLIAASAGTLVLLLGAVGMLIVPDWPIQNLRMIKLYDAIPTPGSLGDALALWLPEAGGTLSLALTLGLSALLAFEWWSARGKGFGWFLWTACLTLAVSQWIGIKTDPGNFLILFPALILVFAGWDSRRGRTGRVATWLSLLLLGVGLWALFVVTLVPGDQPLQSPVMFVPLPLFVVLGLYSMRAVQTLSERRAGRQAADEPSCEPGRREDADPVALRPHSKQVGCDTPFSARFREQPGYQEAGLLVHPQLRAAFPEALRLGD